MSIYPSTTPLSQHFDAFDRQVYHIKYALALIELGEDLLPRVYRRLEELGDPLAKELFAAWDSTLMMGGLRSVDDFPLNEMFLCRAVDTFHLILVTLVGEVMERRPEILRTFDEQVPVRDVLEAANLDDFRKQFADRKLRQLGHFTKIRKLLRNLGVDVQLEHSQDEALTKAIELRNVIVHSGGIVDAEYLKRSRRTDVEVGARLSVTRAYLREVLDVLNAAADAFHVALGQKYFGRGRSALHHHWLPRKPEPEGTPTG